MDTALSLELIKKCLEMDLMSRDCTKVIYDPDTQAFLKKQSENQENILQRLNEEKSRIDEYIESIKHKDAAEIKLTKASTRVVIAQQEYNTGESNAQQAAQSYATALQKYQADNIESALAITKQQLVAYQYCPCPTKTALETKKTALENIKKDLENKALDKTTKDQLKINAHAQLQNSIKLKDQAESELKVLLENEIKIKTYDTEFNSASQKASNVQEMLNQLSALKDEADSDEDIEQDINADEFEESEMVTATNDAVPDYQYEL